MVTFLRLTWRLGRWEIAVLIGGSLLFAAVTALVAWQTSVTEASLQACLTADASRVVISAECKALVDRSNLLGALAPILEGATTVVPFVVGILLGAPLVAREIEKRTAPIAWSLSRSRTRWLVLRAGPLLVAIALGLLLVGQASEALIRATPTGELGFAVLAMHGPLVAARGVAVFCIGVLVGLAMGRTLPAILVTGMAVIALLLVLSLGRMRFMEATATWVPQDPFGSQDFSGVVIYRSGFRDDATGELVPDDEVFQRFPDTFGPEGTGVPPGMTLVYLSTPPGLYPYFVAGEGAALLVISALAAGAALSIIRFRRPELG